MVYTIYLDIYDVSLRLGVLSPASWFLDSTSWQHRGCNTDTSIIALTLTLHSRRYDLIGERNVNERDAG